MTTPLLVSYTDRGQRRQHATLVVDATGVGAAVIDLLHQQGLRPTEVLIHGGAQVSRHGARRYHVPKRDLIVGLQVAFQETRLLIASGLAEAAVFMQELMAVDYKMTPSANDVYVHREGTHDDLVLAVALAYWCAAGRVQHSSGAFVVLGHGL